MPDSERNILICGANWLGDSVMSMPAIDFFKERLPSCRITMLAVEALAELWDMHSCIDRVIPRKPDTAGMLEAIRHVKSADFNSAFLFPNSTRSALIPFLAGVKGIRGMRGSYRSWLLDEIAPPRLSARYAHQSWEYFDIMGLNGTDFEQRGGLPRIRPLNPPEEKTEWARKITQWNNSQPLTALIPGAARGPSKQWPPEHFAQLGELIAEHLSSKIVILGSPKEMELCAQVAGGIKAGTINLAGETSLTELTAVLSLCRTAVTNDSGGMHLASAAGTGVVAVYGLTDPDKTGPLGDACRVVCGKNVGCSRDIPRRSAEAMESLRSITPEKVFESVCGLQEEVTGR